MNEKDIAKDKEWVTGKKPRFLFLDIETSPLIGSAWNVHEAEILWHRMGEILMMGYMWDTDTKPRILSQHHFESWTPKRNQEKKLMYQIKEVLDEADVVVGYNVKKFDIKEINARFMKYGIPEAKTMVLDPLNMIRRNARFPSNKLEDVADYLKIGKKLETGGKYLWKRCMEGDREAWKHMEQYCMNDTLLVKNVFERLKGWDKTTFNINFFIRLGLGCTKCGSKHFHKKGKVFLRTGWKQDYECRACGHRFLGVLVKDNIEPVTTYQ